MSRKTINGRSAANVLMTVGIIIAALLAFGTPSVVLAASDNAALAPRNGIPLVIVRVDETGDNASLEQMNESPDHSVKCAGTVQIIVPDGYTSEYGGISSEQQILLEYIRGRGNSTWQELKKPYKIKFADKDNANEVYLTGKQDLFGMGKSREWALLAGTLDHTLIKNRVTSLLGQSLSFEYTPQMVPVDLVMIGVGDDGETASYLGSYLLSELVGIDKNRVDIDEIKKKAAAEPDITGGYLLSFYNEMQKTEDESTHFKTDAGVELMIEEPEYEGLPEELPASQKAQREYIKGYIQALEDLIVKPETIDEETHNKIAAMMDLDTAADYWWIQEFSRNKDAFITDSTYFYKKREGKLYWGPLWDFDVAYGGQDDGSLLYGKFDGFNNTEMLWFDELRSKDPLFAERLKERWTEVIDVKLGELIEDGGVIDQYYDQMRASQEADRAVWAALYEEDGYGAEDYKAELNKLKDWISRRREWINENLDKIGKVYVTVRFKVNDEFLEGEDKIFRLGASVGEWDAPDAPRIEGSFYRGWVEENSSEPIDDYVLNDDTVFTAVYIPEELAVAPTGLYFSSDETWVPLSQGVTSPLTNEVMPEDTTEPSITWTSSDESIAYVDADGAINLLRAGDVAVTGTLYNGVSNSYTLHVYDPEEDPVQFVQEIVPEAAELTIQTGETRQIKYSLKPEGTPLSAGYTYWHASESSEQSIVSVTGTGVITGLSSGTAEVMINVSPDYMSLPSGYDFDSEEVLSAEKTATVKVHVVDKSSEPSEPSDPIEPAKPSRTKPYIIIPGDNDPTSPTVPTDVKPTKPTNPTSPTDVKPTESNEPTNPTEPADIKPTEPTKPEKPSGNRTKRLGGDDRYDTACKISAEGWDSADTVVIASGENYPDALAGSVLAKKLDAPILLAKANELDEAVMSEIERLGAKNAVILGGYAAVGEGIDKTLGEKNIKVTRIAGATRNDTAALIALKVADHGDSTATAAATNSKKGTVFLVSNAGFADALSVSPTAALRAEPILYINSDGTVPAATKEAIDKLGVKNAFIIGGPEAIGLSAETALNKLGIVSSRVYGATRYETAIAVYDHFRTTYTSVNAAVATGLTSPDALAGGAFCARYGIPIFLADNSLAAGLASRLEHIDTLYIFGGPAAVPESITAILTKR